MKRIITLFTLLLLVFSVEIFAQSPTYFNYQAVIRDNSGGLLVDRLVHVKIAIREGNVSGPIAYQEVHSVTTNTFGLVNLVVGAGAPLQGTMPTVDWVANPHFIDIELDANNTGVYTQMGTTQILSVPYALHSRTVQFNDDADADPTNEIQTFVLQNNELYLDNNGNGGFMVNLNPYLDNTDNQVLSVFDSTTTIRNMLISGGNKVTFSIADNDNDSINEIQQVSILNDTIYLSRGGFIDLKPYLDNTDEQTLTLANDTLVISGSNDTISLLDYRQRLTLQNDTLTLSGSMDTLNLVPYLDNTDEQTLTLTNDTLVISGSNDTISLTSYLDNTDEQTLMLANDTLVISGSYDTISLSNYRQELSLNGDTLLISGGNSIVLPPDSDGDSTNEVQSLSLNGNELTLSISEDTLDLSGYLDNTDNQALSLVNDTLVISGSNDTISLVPYKQILSVSNDTIFLTDGGFVELPSPASIPDLERVGDSINVQGSFTRVSVNDNDADSTNELQTLTFSNDTLILSETQDTIDFSGYSLRIDTNAADIASLYIELDNDSTFLNDLIDSNLVLIGANQTLATGASNLANQNAIDIADLNAELDEDSTNFDTLISNLQSTQQMSDSMLYAKIASDSTNFDTLVAANATDISNLEIRVANDSTNFDTLITNLRSDLSDTSSTLRGLISAASTQASSDLSDTASALRMYTNMVSSQDSGVVHGALTDTASDIRTDYSARFAQLTSDLTDSSQAIRNTINTVIEYVSLNCIYDSSTVGSDLPNSFYFPFSGVHALKNLQNISSSMIMPYDGEVISATVRTDQNLPFNLLKFYKNGVYSNSNIGSGLSAGVFNKSNFSGTTAQKSFSRGDLIQFRFETIAASSSQKIYILIELSYDR